MKRMVVWGSVLSAAWFAACADGSGGDGAEPGSACSAYCSARKEAACPRTDTEADCRSTCDEDAALEPLCSSQFRAMVACASSLPMTCGPGGKPMLTANCATESEAYEACLDANGWVSAGAPCRPYTCAGACSIDGCTECAENTDCAPTQACSDGSCRERCISDADCPGARCRVDTCTDVIGTPCDLDDLFPCAGGECTDVDANLTTVDPYCTVSCALTECPPGTVCQNRECRLQ